MRSATTGSIRSISVIVLTILVPIAAIAQSKTAAPDYGSAMHPKLARTVTDYLGELPLLKSETVGYAGETFFTYVGGDSLDVARAAHQFPNGSVVLGIQTNSPGLPVTDNALKDDYSGTGDDWYVVHFTPETGETHFASYYGTESQDWLSTVECEDVTGRCLFAGGTQDTVGVGKTSGGSNLLVAAVNFMDPETFLPAFLGFCQLFGIDPLDWFANDAFLFAWFATTGGEPGAKVSDPSAIRLGAGICGFRQVENRINGLVAIVNPGSCQLENILESTFETDDSFFGCYADTGLDGSPIPVISAVGLRDNDADFSVGEPATPTLCYAHQNETSMECFDMPGNTPIAPSGKTVESAPNDQYVGIERDPDVGTFALGWNSTSDFGFIDYWPSTDLAVVSSEAPVRVSTDVSLPLGLSVSSMGRVSYTTDFWIDGQYFGQRIGTYAVTNAASGAAASKQSVGQLDFMSWTSAPGVNRAAVMFDLHDYPFRRGYSGASWFGIEASPTAIQSDCPSGESNPCASFAEVTPGLNYVSACNMTAGPVALDFSTSSPEGLTDWGGFFFDVTDTGSIEPNTCSRMFAWPNEGGFNMDLTDAGASPISVSSDGNELTGPFSTVVLTDTATVVDVNDAPTVPHTYAIYFTNTFAESVDLRIYGEDGDLHSASIEPFAASVVNVGQAQLGTTAFIAASTAGGEADVFALDLPVTDFVMQSLITANGTGKSQAGLEILVFNAMGTQAETRVVTSVEQDSELPATYALNANYPNPFNPTTLITFDLPERSSARIEIVNVFGQRIRSWSYEDKAAGRHAVTWDGRDSGGTPVSSGVYLYRLSSDSFQQTRKMTLLR